jgi:hypothetical protein
MNSSLIPIRNMVGSVIVLRFFSISLNVNGFRIDVPREVECDIARPYVENLRHAVETRFEKINGEDVKRDVPRFHWVMVKENINLPILKDKLRKLQVGREAEGNGNDA